MIWNCTTRGEAVSLSHYDWRVDNNISDGVYCSNTMSSMNTHVCTRVHTHTHPGLQLLHPG